MSHARSQKLVYDTHYGVAIGKRMYQNKPPTILDIPLEMQWEAVNIPDPATRSSAPRASASRASASAARCVLCALGDAIGTTTCVAPDAGAAGADHDRSLSRTERVTCTNRSRPTSRKETIPCLSFAT